ncbi:hypothetical protein [Suttonella ornithocola]|uniref:Uncharacterized protein n=1 Tax=Suttonella ornithocola TaxID=279832 RepID=A0A380MW03_9GAMM|nr:hypothetical protein [Suttonella ornithocola]SUO96760.1 Uncharacterised protein [Suttonella ornithocola]
MKHLTKEDLVRLEEILREHYSAANQLRMLLVGFEFAQKIRVDKLQLLDAEHFNLWQKILMTYRDNENIAYADYFVSLAERSKKYLSQLKKAKVDPFR